MSAPLLEQGEAKSGLTYTPSRPKYKPLSNMGEILTLNEVAQLTKMAKSTIYKLTRAGKLKHSKPNGKRIYYRRSDIEEWMMSGVK